MNMQELDWRARRDYRHLMKHLERSQEYNHSEDVKRFLWRTRTELSKLMAEAEEDEEEILHHPCGIETCAICVRRERKWQKLRAREEQKLERFLERNRSAA